MKCLHTIKHADFAHRVVELKQKRLLSWIKICFVILSVLTCMLITVATMALGMKARSLRNLCKCDVGF